MLFRLVSHPDRIAIIEELRLRRQNVGKLAEVVQIPATRVSQHLSALRAFGLVASESEGREQYYHLTQPEIAKWIVDGVDFVAHRVGGISDEDISRARALWGLNEASDVNR
ncbi:MAG: metalloregulator ArsR/SmtB family transcription factor [Pseudomonadota bacterium]